MATAGVTDGPELPAGGFSAWLESATAAIRGDGESDVPCGGCTACCTSGQFVHVGPDEADTLAHIPAELLFPAPRSPEGHLLLGYDEQGRCPMLGDGGCSIYHHRPRACRTYDCRVFAAAGLEPDQPSVADRVRRWRFDVRTPRDRAELAAVRAAARSLADPDAGAERSDAADGATGRAVRAVLHHGDFLEPDGG